MADEETRGESPERKEMEGGPREDRGATEAALIPELVERCAAEIVARACDAGIKCIKKRAKAAFQRKVMYNDEMRRIIAMQEEFGDSSPLGTRRPDLASAFEVSARNYTEAGHAAEALRVQYKGYMLYVTVRNGGVRHRRYGVHGEGITKPRAATITEAVRHRWRPPKAARRSYSSAGWA